MSKKTKHSDENDFVDQMDKFGVWMEKNSKTLMIGFMAFAFILVGFWGFSALQKRSQLNAANAAGLLNRKIDLLERAITNTKNKDDETFKKNKASEVDKLHVEVKNLIQNYPTDATSDFTTIRWASFLRESEKKQDLALEVLNLARPDASRELSATIPLLKAGIFMNQGKEEEAVKIYDEVLSQSGWSLFHSEALIQKATLLEKKGQRDEAITLLTKARDKSSGTAFSKDAEKYLRLLEVKKNHSDLFKTKEG